MRDLRGERSSMISPVSLRELPIIISRLLTGLTTGAGFRAPLVRVEGSGIPDSWCVLLFGSSNCYSPLEKMEQKKHSLVPEQCTAPPLFCQPSVCACHIYSCQREFSEKKARYFSCLKIKNGLSCQALALIPFGIHGKQVGCIGPHLLL
jgi:hypothetical protein